MGVEGAVAILCDCLAAREFHFDDRLTAECETAASLGPSRLLAHDVRWSLSMPVIIAIRDHIGTILQRPDAFSHARI